MSDEVLKTLRMLERHQVALSDLRQSGAGLHLTNGAGDEIREIIELIGEQRRVLEPYRFGPVTPQAAVAQCEALAKVMNASLRCIAECTHGLAGPIDRRVGRFKNE